MTNNKPIGEIIEAGTTAFVAQCLEVPREIVPRLYDPPFRPSPRKKRL